MDATDQAVERLFLMALQGFETFNVALGDRLGLYRLLDESPAGAADLAARAGTSERWTREWLEQQAVTGILTVEQGETMVFRLAPGYAEALARPEELTTVAPLARMASAVGVRLDDIEAAARSGKGVPWTAFGKEMLEAQAAMNKPPLLRQLATGWLPNSLPDVQARLTDGEPLTAADIGTGAGWSAIGLAKEFPQLRVDAYDIDPASVRLATQNVAEAELSDRVRVLDHDLTATDGEAIYDFAIAVECIHDMPNPVGVLAGIRRRLKPGAPVLVIDERVAEQFAPDGDEIERLMYCYSTLICLLDSMSAQDSVVTGTAMRPATLSGYARDAGFPRTTIAPVETDFFRFYVLHQE